MIYQDEDQAIAAQERMAEIEAGQEQAEKAEREKANKAPICTSCGIQMVERTNRETGETFFGCKKYPTCKVTFDGGAYEEPFL